MNIQFDESDNQLFSVFGDENGYLGYMTWERAQENFGVANVEMMTATTGREIIRVFEA